MSLPQQLGHRPAHGVAHGDDRLHAERTAERSDVVGAVLEVKSGRPQATGMTAQVGSQHVELMAQGLEGLEPVEPTARHPAVEQHNRRGARRPGDLPHEYRAASAQRHPPSPRDGRAEPPVGLTYGPGDGVGQPAHERQLRHVDPPAGRTQANGILAQVAAIRGDGRVRHVEGWFSRGRVTKGRGLRGRSRRRRRVRRGGFRRAGCGVARPGSAMPCGGRVRRGRCCRRLPATV